MTKSFFLKASCLMCACLCNASVFSLASAAEKSQVAVEQAASDKTVSEKSSKVNINQDSAETIAAGLKGIGLKRAQAIVEYREENGPFKSVDELSQIKGIGTKVIEANQSQLEI